MSTIDKIINILTNKEISIKNKIKLLSRAYSYHCEKVKVENLYKKVKNTPVEGMILSDFYVTVDPAIRQNLTSSIMSKISYIRS